MNYTPNLPEPTYKWERIVDGFENALAFIKSIVILTKKLLML